MQKLSELFQIALEAERKKKHNGSDPKAGITDEEAVEALAEGLGCDPKDLTVQRIYRRTDE